MDFEKNIDQICYPNYNLGQRTSGLQIIFTDESDYIEPYDIDDFKDFARIDFDTDDNLIELFLRSARITVENYLQKSLGVRKIRLTALSLPKNFRLPWGPVEGLLVDDQLPIPLVSGQSRLNQVFEYGTGNTVTLDFTPTNMLYVALNGQVTDQWTLVDDQLTVTGWDSGYIIVAYYNGTIVSNVTDIRDYTLVGDILKEGGYDVTVNYITNASLVNSNIVNAIYKQALDYYDNREAYLKSEGNMELTNIVKLMLAPYRNVQFP